MSYLTGLLRDYWIMTELFVWIHGSDECTVGSRARNDG